MERESVWSRYTRPFTYILTTVAKGGEMPLQNQGLMKFMDRSD